MPYPASELLRIGRFSERGRLYLLTCVAEGRKAVFQDLRPARLVVEQFRLAQTEGAANSLAWIVMPDHIHWLFDLKQKTLADVMRRIKSRSTLTINRRRRSKERVWQPGYHDRAVREEDDIRKMARYIIANPLRAGLVERVGDYPLWDAVWL